MSNTVHPLLQSQIGIFVECLKYPSSTQYNLPTITQFDEKVDFDHFEQTLLWIYKNSSEWKICFGIDDNGSPYQYIDDTKSLKIKRIKMTDSELQEYAHSQFCRPFDIIGSEPLVRFEFVFTEKSKYVLMDVHHLIMDGMSFMPIFCHSIFPRAYDGFNWSPTRYGMLDAADAEPSIFRGERYEMAKNYYCQKFAGLQFATLSSKPLATVGKMVREHSFVDINVVNEWCQVYNVRPNLLFQAAFSYVLSSLLHQNVIAYIMESHGRYDRRLRDAIGMFVRQQPVMSKIIHGQSVLEYIKSFHSELVSAVRYSVYPFTHFCRDLGITPGVIFNFMASSDATEDIWIDDRRYPAIQIDRQSVFCDMSVLIFLVGNKYDIRTESSEMMNDRNTLRMVANAIRETVLNMMAGPESTIESISIVSAEEERELIKLGTGEHLYCDRSLTFVDMFEAQVCRTPDNVAVIDQNSQLTYRELDEQSTILAHCLKDEKGVCANDFVALMLSRRKEFVVSVIGVWKSGAAYVPIDPEYPEDRKRFMMEDSEVKFVIDDGFFTGEMSANTDDINLSRPEGLAYMIYTSGTTGKPKGVMICHSCLSFFMSWLPDELELKPGDDVAEYSSFSFDASVCDIYPSLVRGVTLHILSSELRMDMNGLYNYIGNNQIVGMTCPTQVGMELLNVYDLKLRYMVMGGEKLKPVRNTSVKLYNGYGPTEYTVWSSHHVVDQSKDLFDIPIGRPVPGSLSLVLDASRRILPCGAVGELCLVGFQLSKGYWHRPELTSEKFIECPYLPGEKMYCTGDLVRWNDGGELEFIGRIDNQVKLRGYRIELGEIESVAYRCSGIVQAVAMVRNDVLCLFYVGDADESDLRDTLSRSLTDYMIPSVFMRLEAMPLTHNGKIDRKSLPEPVTRAVEYVTPSNEVERAITDAMRSVLDRDTPVGVLDGFYSIGGDSIKAMRLVSVLRKDGILLSVSQIIKLQTAVRLAEETVLSDGDDGLMVDYIQVEPPVSEVFSSEIEYERVRNEFADRDETILRVYPLTPMQESMLSKHLSEPSSWGYRIVSRYSLNVVPEEKQLRTALDVLSEQHEVLRTSILYRDVETPLQVIVDRRLELRFENVIDEEDILRIHRRELDRGFDLERDSLFRLICIRTGEHSCQILVAVHHIIVDGWSLPIYMGHLFGNLRDTMEGKETHVSHSDDGKYGRYVRSLRCLDRDSAIEYWSDLLDGYETRAEIPSYGRPDGEGSGQIYVSMDVRSTEALQMLVSDNSSSLANAVELAWGIVLQCYSRQDDVVFARVVSGRNHCGEDMDTVVGLFINSVPVRIKTDSHMDVRSALRMVSSQGAESSVWDYCGMSDIQSASVLGRGLFQSIVAFENYPLEIETISALTDGFKVEPVFIEEESFNDITIAVHVTSLRELQLHLTYDVRKYNRSDMERLVGSCKTVLAKMASDSSVKIGDLSLTTTADEQELIRLGTGEKLDYDNNLTFIDMFESQVHRTPDNVALVFENKCYTYSEVDAITSRIASILMGKGVVKETIVGIMIERSERMVLYPLSVMKAGGSYLPLDTSYPSVRLHMMCDDSGVGIIISEGNLVEEKLAGYGGIVLNEPELMEFLSEAIQLPQTSPDDRFVILYTSGSTGKPKGVELEYRGIVNFCHWYVKEFDMTETDRSLAYASFSFDAHMIGMYPALTCGAATCIVPSESRMDPVLLNEYMVHNNVSIAFLTTQMACLLMSSTSNKSLRLLSFGGEKLPPVSRQPYKMYHVYGPTECTLFSSFFRIEKDYTSESAPIGHSLYNYRCYVLDNHMSMIPKGAVGELFIGGYGVGRGYLNRPELTEERFIEWRGQRVYRTGDLVRWNDAGELEFIGRVDNQVKLRGYRIELGEIESVASRCQGIGQAVAVVRNDVLCLYYTGEVSDSVLRGMLSESLAEYMVPGVLIRMDLLPLTPNGKIDHKSLPEPELIAEDVVLPSTPLEQSVYEFVSESLRLEGFGVTTNLVSIGMTSISAMRLSMSIRSRFGVSVAMTDLLSCPTVRDLCELISHSSGSDTGFGSVQPLREYYPLTPNQLGVYIDWEGHRDGLQYNVPAAIKMDGISVDVLHEAVRSVIDAHPILKMRLAVVEGEVKMHRDDGLAPEVTVSQLPSVDDHGLRSFFQSRVRPFDLFTDTLYRFEIYAGDGSVYLFKDVHHIVTDGLSEGMLLREILSCCAGVQPEKEVYTAYDYSLESEAYLSTEEYDSDGTYFRTLVSGMESTSYPRSRDASGTGCSCTASLSVPKDRIVGLSSKLGVTVNTYMLHSLLQVLRSITREERVLVTTVSHGRSHGCIENCQGFFVRTLPVVSTDSAEDLQRQLVSSMRHEEYPLTRLVEETGLRPEILYAYEGQLLDARDGSGHISKTYPLSLDTPKVPLTITVNPDREDVFELMAEYDDSLYSGNDMETLLRCVLNMAGYGRLVSMDEERELLRLGAGEKLDYDRSQTFVDMFEAQVRRTPDNVAVVYQDRRYTYSEVDSITSKMAGILIENGVVRETIVGVMIDRSERLVLYPLSVMKAGGSYLPLDTSYPSARLHMMCDDSGVGIIISEGNLVEEKLAGYGGIVLKEPELMESMSGTIRLPQTSPDDRFVILYTSGSMGTPKGVELEYRGIVNFCRWYVREFGMTESDRSLAYSSFSFDAHMMDIYPAMSCGAGVYILPDSMRFDIQRLNTYIETENITVAYMTTRLGQMFVETTDNRSLRLLSVGGEKLNAVRKPRYRLYNGYGPTECTIYSTFYNISMDYDCDVIGRSLSNVDVYVLDSRMSALPKGSVGELYIGGYGVGRGYHNRPELTAEKFVDNPYIPGEKIYRTGDLVRWNDNGELEYIGRIDNQVKLRGYRIELGEIESVASRCQSVGQVIAVVRNDMLCLYYTGDADESDIRDTLSESLADYMVPDVFICLDTIPLTPNGKIDKKHLPEPIIRRSTYEKPSTAMQFAIADAFAFVLKLECVVDIDAKFIYIGGDSIKAMRLVSYLRTKCIQITVSQVLKLQTIRCISEVAVKIDFEENYIEQFLPTINSKDYINVPYPLHESAQVMFDIWAENVLTLANNIPMLFHFTKLQCAHVKVALESVFASHPYLNVRIERRESEFVQIIKETGLIIEETILDEIPTMEYFKNKVRPFNVLGEPLYHIELVDIREYCGCYLFFDINHLIFDGYSEGIFLRDFARALSGIKLDGEKWITLETYMLEESFLECSSIIKAENYFDDLLCGIHPTVPTHTCVDSYLQCENRVSSTVSTEIVTSFVRSFAITESNLFLTSIMYSLHTLIGQQDIAVTMGHNGRNYQCMMDSIGMFVKTIPVVLKRINTFTFIDAVRLIQEQVLNTLEFGYYSTVRMVERYKWSNDIVYIYQGNMDRDNIVLSDVNKYRLTDMIIPSVPMLVNAYPVGNDYEITLMFDNTRFSVNDMQKIVNEVTSIISNEYKKLVK